MNKDQTDGIGKQVKGGFKEAVSKVTGNKAGEMEGKIEKAVGKVQTKVGNAVEEDRRNRERP